MTTGQSNPRLWFIGARVWAMWNLMSIPRFELYDLVDYQGMSGQFVFKSRRRDVKIAMTIPQIQANGAFKPFCVNSEHLFSGSLFSMEKTNASI